MGDPGAPRRARAAPATSSPTSTRTACSRAPTSTCCARCAPAPTVRSSPPAASRPWRTSRRSATLVADGRRGRDRRVGALPRRVHAARGPRRRGPAVTSASPARRRLGTANPYEERYGYSRALRTGDRVLVSGCTSLVDGQVRHPGDAAAQARVALDTAVSSVVALGGCAADVVLTRMYVVDRAHCDAVGLVHGELFAARAPGGDDGRRRRAGGRADAGRGGARGPDRHGDAAGPPGPVRRAAGMSAAGPRPDRRRARLRRPALVRPRAVRHGLRRRPRRRPTRASWPRSGAPHGRPSSSRRSPRHACSCRSSPRPVRWTPPASSRSRSPRTWRW